MAVEEKEGHPILSGLVALVGVGLAVGLVLGGAALVGAKATGLDGRTKAAEDTSTASLYLPLPSPTKRPTAPQYTLAAGSTPPVPTSSFPTDTPQADGIMLSTSASSYSPGAEIDFDGTYPSGEGVALQIQRLEDGTWTDFPVVAHVNGGTFSTFIMTSKTGMMKFRVYDAGARRASNVVTVTVG